MSSSRMLGKGGEGGQEEGKEEEVVEELMTTKPT